MIFPLAMLTYRVNIPDVSSGAFEPAVFWFGAVTPTINSSDVRMWYHENAVEVTLHIIDRRLWHQSTPAKPTLDEWDSVTVLVNLDGNKANSPTVNSYRFVIQYGATENDDRYQASFRGTGSAWESVPIPFTAESSYRGEGGVNSDSDNKGWQLSLVLPFSTLSLPGPPPEGSVWDLGFAVHDRDDVYGTPIADQVWPGQMDPDNPSTWGQLHFGRSRYAGPNKLPQGIITIQGGFDGITVPDAHVGGNFTCGEGMDHWSEWGEANYASSTQINIQNQWDVAEYPCFSKYFVTFPLDLIPSGKVIVAAKLHMNLFGNAGGGQWGEPPDSYIQALTVGDAWDEATINWNNAPLALENISGTWVKPVQTSGQRHYSWDVGKAVEEANQSGEPVRLALYSADGEMHTGKYFFSSDADDWGGTVRPSLQVVYGIFCDDSDISCNLTNLPVIAR